MQLYELMRECDFSTPEKSWSPCFSSVGIGAGETIKGAGSLWLHYNRKTREVCEHLIGFDLALNTEQTSVVRLSWGGSTSLFAGDTNAFFFTSDELPSVTLFEGLSDSVNEFRAEEFSEQSAFLRGFSQTPEARDPDEESPFAVALVIGEGMLTAENGRFSVRAVDGRISFGIVIRVQEIYKNEMLGKASSVIGKVSGGGIAGLSAYWSGACDRLNATLPGRNDNLLVAKAVRALVMNTTRGEGSLKKYMSCYPSRGTYPTHYLWDTYFQNLGYRVFDERLPVEFLLQIAQHCREDGKLPQFMCSTWGRPQDSQGALLGWAVLNIIDLFSDRSELEQMYRALVKNNRWWLTARLAPCGLVYSPSGLETGQDNSPRFDDGATIPCDMNAYLLSQIKATAVIAEKLGDAEGAAYHNALARDFSKKLYDNLYCREEGLFLDRSRKTGEFIHVRSNACVLPVWAGVEMPEEEKKSIIENFLLDENAMFGRVPFPSVAYDDEKYESAEWWRGPTWMPIAWLLKETLEANGYAREAVLAEERLYDIIVRDGQMSELFDSQTGEGLGARQQGWTSGIFIRLASDIQKRCAQLYKPTSVDSPNPAYVP